MRCLTGQLVPQGQVLVDGVSVIRYDPRELARLMAHVPQETQLAFDYTVLQVVLMGRSPHLGRFGFESGSDVEIARQCLAATDTDRFEHRHFDELSSGERQRVVIARALAQQPTILLLDEPTSFLDIGHQLQINRLLRDLTRQGITVVSVSHDLNLAAQFSDELILLSDGRVVADGPVDTVLQGDIVGHVYDVVVDVVTDPRTSKPFIIPRTAEGE
jgi:iron complex transport system ATP-binding protein